MGIDAARDILHAAIGRRLFPAAVALVASGRETLWHEAFGHLSFEPSARPTSRDSWFDLASLTKPLATTTVVLDLVSRGQLSLDAPVARWLPGWRGADRASVTVADLLEHASGLGARLPAGPWPASREAWLPAICSSALEYPPRSRALYSDLGFILLGLLAEQVAGDRLDVLFARQVDRLAEGHPDVRALTYHLPIAAQGNTAPTCPLPEDQRGRSMLTGEVHDNYAADLEGVAGHAGLFGTAAAVGSFAGAVLSAARGDSELAGAFSPRLVKRATTRSTVAGSSRMLGWDGMLPSSSCGERMSPTAFGHVGFTGTSLWIDVDRDRLYVLLTNRVCGGGSIDEMRVVRRAFHDALADL